MTYLILDARYEETREGGRVIPWAILTSIGVLPGGSRSIPMAGGELRPQRGRVAPAGLPAMPRRPDALTSDVCLSDSADHPMQTIVRREITTCGIQ